MSHNLGMIKADTKSSDYSSHEFAHLDLDIPKTVYYRLRIIENSHVYYLEGQGDLSRFITAITGAIIGATRVINMLTKVGGADSNVLFFVVGSSPRISAPQEQSTVDKDKIGGPPNL